MAGNYLCLHLTNTSIRLWGSHLQQSSCNSVVCHSLLMVLSQSPWYGMDFAWRGMSLSLQRQSSRKLIQQQLQLSLGFSKAYAKTTLQLSTTPECLASQNSQSSAAVFSLWLACVFRSEAPHRWFISNEATADKAPKQFSAWIITANLLQMLNRWNLYMTSLSINTSTLSYFNCWCNNTMWLFLKGKYMNLGAWLFVFSVQ